MMRSVCAARSILNCAVEKKLAALRSAAQGYLEKKADPTEGRIATSFCRSCVEPDQAQIIRNLVTRDDRVLLLRGNDILAGPAFVGRPPTADADEDMEGPGAEDADRVPVPEGISPRIQNLYLLELDLRGQLESFLNPPPGAEATRHSSRPPWPSSSNRLTSIRACLAGAADRDDADDGELDNEQAGLAWQSLEAHLREGYTNRQGGFARLMYGETKPQARRMMQLAFNRPNSSPRVLVAQSLVGREGLNLHESCRIVVLLHPEWNPGVVEQQIGRVDRVNCRWAKELNNAVADGKTGSDLPRIEIHAVIFKGTYDEHNWKVLQERWDDLRAQLHGEALPARLRVAEDDEGRLILDEIAQARPKFSPA